MGRSKYLDDRISLLEHNGRILDYTVRQLKWAGRQEPAPHLADYDPRPGLGRATNVAQGLIWAAHLVISQALSLVDLELDGTAAGLEAHLAEVRRLYKTRAVAEAEDRLVRLQGTADEEELLAALEELLAALEELRRRADTQAEEAAFAGPLPRGPRPAAFVGEAGEVEPTASRS